MSQTRLAATARGARLAISLGESCLDQNTAQRAPQAVAANRGYHLPFATPMDIVLTTLNAKYAHAAFGLRYLMANLGPLQSRAALLEFDINQRSVDVLEAVLVHHPKIVGIGVYIWNASQVTQLVADLKRVRPEIIIILGGPEISYETEQQPLANLADYIIAGEADIAFAQLCEKLLARQRPLLKIIPADLPEFELKPQSQPHHRPLELPYHFYTETDLAQRVVYVEASRGCPFKCEFCLSSLDVPVRNVPLKPFLTAMQSLLDRGLQHFKFVDRTFNLNLNLSRAILDFFLQRYRPGLFLHFEMIPDRLPGALRGSIAAFPAGALQFEVGIQTFNEDVADLISRRQDNAKVTENLRFLREHTGVHVHADLIVGLPGEDISSFGAGFDRLVAMRPQEIQVGMLKRLRGTPITRHDLPWQMVYSPHPPYEILQTKLIDFRAMQRMRRFSRYWDLIANSGNFIETTPLLWEGASPFARMLALSDWLFDQIGRNHAISLQNLAQLLFQYLTQTLHRDVPTVAQTLWRDYQRGGRSDMPPFLKGHVAPADTRKPRKATPARQSRHLG